MEKNRKQEETLEQIEKVWKVMVEWSGVDW